jgi:hypothetical protein
VSICLTSCFSRILSISFTVSVAKDAILALSNTIEGADCAILRCFLCGQLLGRSEKMTRFRDTYTRVESKEKRKFADICRAVMPPSVQSMDRGSMMPCFPLWEFVGIYKLQPPT